MEENLDWLTALEPVEAEGAEATVVAAEVPTGLPSSSRPWLRRLRPR